METRPDGSTKTAAHFPRSGFLADHAEYMPATHEPLHRVVHRMAHMHFLGPLPPEQLAPDSYIKLSFIMEGVPRYFDGDGAAMDWHDGVSAMYRPAMASWPPVMGL